MLKVELMNIWHKDVDLLKTAFNVIDAWLVFLEFFSVAWQYISVHVYIGDLGSLTISLYMLCIYGYYDHYIYYSQTHW